MPSRTRFPSRNKRTFERKVDIRDLRERFLIVCEGEKTEPNYFRSFRVPKAVIAVLGVGANTVSLVQRAVRLMDQEEFDQVWCVFDRNSFPAKNFNAALTLANTNGIKVAYSNEAFELWYLLHFNYYHTAITRASYIKRLSGLLGFTYEKNSEVIYEVLESRQRDAMRNAERLLNEYPEFAPERNNPSTTVHLLVTELNRFAV